MNKELYIAVALSDEAKRFFDTELGQHLIRTSASEIEDLRSQFESLDPNDIKGMRKIHFKMNVATEALNWLGQVITAGDHALAQIQSGEQAPE